MSLQKKIVILFMTLGAVFALGSYAGLSAIVFPTFEQFEKASAKESLARVRRALDAEFDSLEVINREYSEWDHTYAFVQGLRDSFVEENLDIAYWTNIDINAMFYFDLEGQLIWGAIVDASITTRLPIEDELLQPLGSNNPLLQHRDEPGTYRGILQATAAPLLVSSQPILTSSAGGPPAGTLVIAKFLTEELVQELGVRAGVDVAIQPVGDGDTAEATWSYSDAAATGRQMITDIYGTPTFVLEVNTPRTITAIGENTISTALAFFVVATALFLLGAWIFTRNLIVAPVTSLTGHIKEIRKTGKLEQTQTSERSDEIGELEQEFGNLARILGDARQELESARDKALAISNAKSEFLAKMSHEIRTPMNGVLGMIELLGNTPLDKAQKRYMHSISHSADTLLDIINDILDFSKLEAGKLRLESRAFNLNSFIADITDSLSGLADRKGLRLNNIVPDGPPINVEGDPVRLRQIVTNLLGNAIKFTKQGGVLLKVSSEPDMGDFEYVTIEVIDTGIGISPKKHQQIFESFAQEDGSTTRRYGGTGLGLAISKQLVEMMGGTIKLQSEPGEGSNFSFTLRLRADREGDMTGIEKTFTHVYGDLDPNQSALQPLHGRVLVAEDNAVNEAVAVGMLDAMGVESVVATDGQEAVELFNSQPFDAVLMDCQMPVLDGFQAAAEIRRIESRKKTDPIRIIAMTANAMAGDMEKCIAAGMDDYLRKPYKGEQLNAALIKVLQPGEVPDVIKTEPESPVMLDRFVDDSANEAIDDTALASLETLPHAGNHELVQQVIQTYINTSMDLMTRLGEAIDCSDSECIRSAAHSLKSSSANVGANALAELCASMETSTRRSDRATAVTLQRQIREEYPRVIKSLKRKLANAAA
jgi:signal transduction histidine kinase/CheY-like chemotaxis protein